MPDHFQLPTFTFLSGGSFETRKQFAIELSKLDPGLGTFDLSEPLRMATSCLFFGGFNGTNDLLTTQALDAPLPIEIAGPARTVRDWQDALHSTLMNQCGTGVLGEIAYREYIEDGSLFSRFLYRDLEIPADTLPFLNHHGAKSCLVLQLGELGITTALGFNGVKRLWLPEPSIEAKIASLASELTKVG